MSSEYNSPTLSRRAFLRNAALGMAGLFLLPEILFAQEKTGKREASPYAPFRMGIQSYSLRGYKLDEALDKTQTLGLKYWEAWDGHIPVTDDPQKIAEYKEKFKSRGIQLVTYGVLGFSGDEVDARKKFVFAKAMGIENLSAYPTPDAFPVLDKLVEEYKINIAIHNHGPGDSMYDKIEKEVKALEGHNVRIGSCDDTGHYLRSDEDPVEAARKFGKRVYGVHLKDANADHSFTEIGKGKLDTVALLKVLKANHYRGIVALEYEEHADNPMPYIEECLAAVREAVKKVR